MKHKMKKPIAILLLVVLLMATIVSCTQPQEDENDAVIPINPLPDTGSKEKTTTRLYFGYLDQRLLVGESRAVDVMEFESIEKSIINAMAKEGPSAERVDFTQLINPNTDVRNVESQGQFLFITLSSDFLLPPNGKEVDLLNDEQMAAEKRRRYLAVYSIVDTLIEQGTYSRVSILIEEDGSRRPLTQAEAGLENSDEPTEPFERNGDLVLTAPNTMREILDALEKKDWNTLYGYIAYKTTYGQDKPLLDDFINEMVTARVAITNHNIWDDVIAQDGASDIVMVDYELKLGEADVRSLSNIPIRLIQENGLWKITYNVFKSKFMT